METIKNLKQGDYFKLKESNKTIYIRGKYNRYDKKFECCKFDDVNDYRYFKGNKEVFVNFEF